MDFENIELSDIFSNTYKNYEKDGIGRVTIRNNTKNNISKLKVLFTIKNFMDFASESVITDLTPGIWPDTVMRDYRAGKLLKHHSGRIDTSAIQQVLKDHFDKPNSICTHTDVNLPPHQHDQTNVSLIMDLTAKRFDIIMNHNHNEVIHAREGAIKDITIRNIPEDLYRIITRMAKRNRRSIQQQILTILYRARVLDNESPVEKALEIRQRLAGRRLGNTIEEIHMERNR